MRCYGGPTVPAATSARRSCLETGYQLPPMREATLPILRGDMLVFATDGVRHGFASDPPLPATAQEHAEHILREHGKTTDDALVLVVKYLGVRP